MTRSKTHVIGLAVPVSRHEQVIAGISNVGSTGLPETDQFVFSSPAS